VADLHPNDCYVIQRAKGVAYFGEPLPELLQLQSQLGGAVSHRLESRFAHRECGLARCLDLSSLTDAITARLLESGDRRYRRSATHRPTPLDNLRGGVYSEVGSDDRTRYRQAPEQRMAYLHLATASRGNCYEAKTVRTLTIHIRDHQQRTDRTGVYSGFLYVEHHHPPIAGTVARGLRIMEPGDHGDPSFVWVDSFRSLFLTFPFSWPEKNEESERFNSKEWRAHE